MANMTTIYVDDCLAKTEAMHKYAAQLGFAWRRAKKWLKPELNPEDSVMHLSSDIDNDMVLLDLHGELLVRLRDRLRPKDGVPLGENLKRAKKDFRSAAAYLRPLATRTEQRPPLKPIPSLAEDERPGPDDLVFPMDSWSPPPTPHPTSLPPTPQDPVMIKRLENTEKRTSNNA